MRRIICWLATVSTLVVLTGCYGGSVVKENSEMSRQEFMECAEEEAAIPTEAEVLAMRDVVLENMAEDDIARLKNTVKKANLAMEGDYLNGNTLEKMEDPESLAWNYIDELGEIHIGWAYNTEDLQ